MDARAEGSMGWKREKQYCPDHGEVLAKQRTVPAILWWFIFVFSQGDFSADHPYRCPKCGRLTEWEAPE
jgi:hypothetical protein